MSECLITRAARHFPDATALIDECGPLSYTDLDLYTEVAEYSLHSHGVESGGLIAILSETNLYYIPILFALARLGAAICPLSVRLPSEALAHQLDNIGSRRVIVAEDLTGRIQSERIEVISLVKALVAEGVLCTELPPVDEAATIIHSSGSSAVAKAIRHRWSAHVASAAGSNENINLEPGDRWLLSLPLYHVGGLSILFRCFLAGAAAVVPNPGASLLDSLIHFTPTHLSVVPTQLRRLLSTGIPDEVKTQLKAVLIGGAAVPSGLVEQARQAGLPVHTSYGSTEMASQITTTRPGADLDELATSGYLLNGRELSVATDGELLVRGKTLCEGFVVNGKLTLPFDRNGWYATGDIGRFDDNGRLLVCGRKDRMFISGGENIHPEEIERALLAIKGIVEVVVFAEGDREYGHRPRAVIAIEAGLEINRNALIGYLEKAVERFKIPDRFYLWPKQDGAGAMKPDRCSIEQCCRAGELEELI
ncbi:MAG TPA: o-succinylbenzoate--CoA ligase [candidate division Zixibacteria bacterium]|nr:o-succinylbenzoate--CoA ligase [candidate division Zixibacteria bacterium]